MKIDSIPAGAAGVLAVTGILAITFSQTSSPAVASHPSNMTSVTVTIENLAPMGGTFLTPVWVGFHDGGFDLYDNGAAVSAELERLAELLELLRGSGGSGTPRVGPDNLELDFGLARGLAYYNGIIFEVRHPSLPGPLGGGGRYDDLARALGSKDTVPALGFAYNLEALLLIPELDISHQDSRAGLPRVLVAAVDRQSFGAAREKVEDLGLAGYSAELDLEDRSLEESLSHARQRGMEQLVWVSADGQAATHRVD